MFCPRCSQEQISEQIKFCSRCGFPLGLVAEVVAHNGILPQLAGMDKNKKRLTRRNGLLFALFWFLIFVLILTPMFGVLDVDELAAMCALLGTMGAIILTVASFVFLKNEPKLNGSYNQPLPTYQANNLYGSPQTA